jgi:hypothetical protein
MRRRSCDDLHRLEATATDRGLASSEEAELGPRRIPRTQGTASVAVRQRLSARPPRDRSAAMTIG